MRAFRTSLRGGSLLNPNAKSTLAAAGSSGGAVRWIVRNRCLEILDCLRQVLFTRKGTPPEDRRFGCRSDFNGPMGNQTGWDHPPRSFSAA